MLLRHDPEDIILKSLAVSYDIKSVIDLSDSFSQDHFILRFMKMSNTTEHNMVSR